MIEFLLGLIVGVVLLAVGAKVFEARRTKVDPHEGWFTVSGLWKNSKERYTLHTQASDARGAEDQARWEAAQNSADTLLIANVFQGKLENADKYAVFEDPDVRPADWMTPEAGRIGHDPVTGEFGKPQ